MKKEFEVVTAITYVGPGHPGYQKPDIGRDDKSVLRIKQFLSWEDCGKSCWQHPDEPEIFTIITTPNGNQTIDMPFDEVCEKIKQAQEKVESELEELVSRQVIAIQKISAVIGEHLNIKV